MSRRGILQSSVASLLVPLVASLPSPVSAATAPSRVLVLGSTGLIGSAVTDKLDSLGLANVGTSTDGRDGTLAFKVPVTGLSTADVDGLIGRVGKFDAVISCVGAIGSGNDYNVNGATALIARTVNVPVTYISVATEVKESVGGVGALREYMRGKDESEAAVISGGGSIIRPTFVYGGSTFGVNPPRVTSGYGRIIEGLLSTGVARAAAGISPGIIKVALEPPVAAEDVAGAAVAKCLGKDGDAATHDGIVNLAKSL